MSWIAVAATAVLLVAGAACSPIDVTEPAKDLLPPKAESVPTPATDLMPPSESAEKGWLAAEDLVAPPEEESSAKKSPATLFLINIYAVKNRTTEDSNDVLRSDVIEEVPDESSEPLAMFILVVEEEDEDHPVSLDEVAKDLEQEGFNIEKVAKDGETRIVKVDLGSIGSMVKVDGETKNDAIGKIIADAAERRAQEVTEQPETDDSAKLMKVRRKRHLHKHHRDRECSICGGGGGGGYYPAQPVYQPVVLPQPVIIPGGGGGGYNRPCNTCGGGGGGYGPQYGGNGGGYGGGNSYAQAQASAQASAQSSGYGK